LAEGGFRGPVVTGSDGAMCARGESAPPAADTATGTAGPAIAETGEAMTGRAAALVPTAGADDAAPVMYFCGGGLLGNGGGPRSAATAEEADAGTCAVPGVAGAVAGSSGTGLVGGGASPWGSLAATAATSFKTLTCVTQ